MPADTLYGVWVITKLYFVIFEALRNQWPWTSIRGHSRSYMLAAIESPCTTLDRPLIVTFALSSAISEILPISYAMSRFFHTPLLFRLKFGDVPFGVDPWCQGLQRKEKKIRLISREIIFQRHRHADRRTACHGNTALCVESRGKNVRYKTCVHIDEKHSWNKKKASANAIKIYPDPEILSEKFLA